MIANKVNTNNKNVIIRDSIFYLHSKKERRNKKYNPTLTLKLPKIEDEKAFKKHLYNKNEIVYDKPKDNKGRWYIGTTKTKQGTRQINMCETVCNALMNYKKKQHYIL